VLTPLFCLESVVRPVESIGGQSSSPLRSPAACPKAEFIIHGNSELKIYSRCRDDRRPHLLKDNQGHQVYWCGNVSGC